MEKVSKKEALIASLMTKKSSAHTQPVGCRSSGKP